MSFVFSPPKTEHFAKVMGSQLLFKDVSKPRLYKPIDFYLATTAIRIFYETKPIKLVRPRIPRTELIGGMSDFEWFLKVNDAFSDFKGQYVAILDKKVVSHGKTASEVLKKTKNLPRMPLVCFVPTDEVLEL